MKVGIAIDDWKLPTFERRLTAAGYTFDTSKMTDDGCLFLRVNTENVQALAVVIQAANDEAERTGAPQG